MTIQVFTRSSNADLYKRMREFIPDDVECIRCDDFRDWKDARTYLHHIINTGTQWVVSVDDDLYISDWQAVLDIIAHMEENDYEVCGMPDGGVCPHRSYSWATLNPFFLVMNVDAIRKGTYSHLPTWLIDSMGFNWRWEDKKPEIIKGRYNHTQDEIFHPLFYFLYDSYDVLFLNAYQHNDGWTTMLQWNNKPFAYHAWMAREYDKDRAHTARIDALYEEVKSIKKPT